MWSKAPPPPPPPPPSPLAGWEAVIQQIPLLQGWDEASILLAAAMLAIYALFTAAVGGGDAKPKPFPAGLDVRHACPGGVRSASSLWQRMSGALAATIFTVTYILVPLLLIAIPCLVVMKPRWWVTWALAGPFVLSALVPPIPSRSFLQSWPFKYMPSYFNFSEVRETSDEDVQALIKSRPVIFSIQPHGVFSFGGASAGVEWAKRWWHPKQIPTSAASSVMLTPLVKHVVGLCVRTGLDPWVSLGSQSRDATQSLAAPSCAWCLVLAVVLCANLHVPIVTCPYCCCSSVMLPCIRIAAVYPYC